MSKGAFEITWLTTISAVYVSGVPFTFFEDKKFNIFLASDPRFVVLSTKIKDCKFPPTYVPLSNVAYFHLKALPEETKKEDKVKK